MNIKIKAITLLLQLFGGKMLANIRKFLAGKKFYLLCAGAILAALAGYAEGTLTLLQFLQACYAAIAGVAFKAGITRDLNNGK